MQQTLAFIFILMAGCSTAPEKQFPITGTVERYDSSVNEIIDPDAKGEIIAEGLEWSEGPLWIEEENMLLFSDVPMNTIYKWTVEKGKEVYLTPSGYTDSAKRGGETGSNGLTLDNDGKLVLCQHGDRRMARMNAALTSPKAEYTPLAAQYNGKRFSSPNDAVFNSSGELFFTDPPYGLPMQNDSDSTKEMAWNGVYKVKKTGEVILLVDSLTRPNGIAFLPGQKQLIVANSDPDKPNWYLFDVSGDSLINGRIFYSATDRGSQPGLPDGLKVDKKGNVFATGPGGLHIFNSKGKLLGKLKLENATSNCALSADEKTVYITNDMYIVRFKLRD